MKLDDPFVTTPLQFCDVGPLAYPLAAQRRDFGVKVSSVLEGQDRALPGDAGREVIEHA